MATDLIKLIHNGKSDSFRPDQVNKITYHDDDDYIIIRLMGNCEIKFVTASPTDALAKLALIEAAMVNTGDLTVITDENVAP